MALASLSEEMKAEPRCANKLQTDIDGIIEHLESFNDVWARTIEVAIGTWLLGRQVGPTCVVPFNRPCIETCKAFILIFGTSMSGRPEASGEDNRRESADLES